MSPVLSDERLREILASLEEPNTSMAVRLADKLIAEGFQEPDEHLAVLSKAVIMLHDDLLLALSRRAAEQQEPYSGPFADPLEEGQPIRWCVSCSNIDDEWFTDEASAEQWANSQGHYDATITVWRASPQPPVPPGSGVSEEMRSWTATALTSVTIAKALPAVAAEYDFGAAEDSLRKLWTALRDPSLQSPSAPGETRVKPLMWRDLTSPREDGPAEPTGVVEASTMIGEYSVCFDAHEDVAESPWCCWSPNECVGHFADFDEAKSAAYADFEQRIKSTLEPAAPVGEMAPEDKQALARAAEFFENLATMGNPAPLAFSQAIRRALLGGSHDR